MENRFERFHPLVSFLYYAGSISLLLLMIHPVFLFLGLLVILAVNFLHDRWKGLRQWLWMFITIVFFLFLLNPLFNQRGIHVLFTLGNHRFTLEALTYGGMNALSIICVMALFISYNVIMTPNKLLYLFSKFMPQFAILLMLTIRFIPLMRRRMEEISGIQRSKGITVVQGRWKNKVKTAMLYVQVLVTYSLEEALQTADSMKARGYGQTSRSSYEYFRIHKQDVFAIILLVVLFALCILGRISGYGLLTVYPLMESWHLSGTDWQVLICYLLFLSFPLLTEAGEMFRWRLSN